MKRTARGFRSFAGFAVVALVLAVGVWLVSPGVKAGAEQRGPQPRVVLGKVVDGKNDAVNGAVVYLKDDHSLSVKSYITDADGTYRFGQLAQTTDYEVWAESGGKKSAVKTISSYDSKDRFVMDLKIAK